MSESLLTQRLDKWLWAARFFKTRSLAAAAIESGKILWNDQRPKPSREIKVGDVLDIVAGEQHWTVSICGLNSQRRPASEARNLYAETSASFERRSKASELRKLAPEPAAGVRGRPTKRDGRHIRRFTGEGV